MNMSQKRWYLTYKLKKFFETLLEREESLKIVTKKKNRGFGQAPFVKNGSNWKATLNIIQVQEFENA